jgi:hypothetical protein
MKIDHLLSIVMYLLNRELVNARELADHFEVSVRTIQRDMDTLTYAGFPVVSIQGPHGGFGIMKSYQLDRQLVDTDDLFFILTSLESVSSTLKSKNMSSTIEKMKTLVRDYQKKEIEKRKDLLYIDLSALTHLAITYTPLFYYYTIPSFHNSNPQFLHYSSFFIQHPVSRIKLPVSFLRPPVSDLYF